jgi:hypothetical protein
MSRIVIIVALACSLLASSCCCVSTDTLANTDAAQLNLPANP